jgi:deazaflavin-dependent oxidoreductase (nitroreductase family)
MSHTDTPADRAHPAHRAMRALAGTAPVARVFARVLHRFDLDVHRRSSGRSTLTTVVSGLPVVLLTTTGARTGEPRTWPLVGLRDGARTVVVASNFGRRHHPAWDHNVRAHPSATLTVGGRATAVRATEATGPERDRLWAAALRVYPAWAAYERRAAPRRIPVLVLTPDLKVATPGRIPPM